MDFFEDFVNNGLAKMVPDPEFLSFLQYMG